MYQGSAVLGGAALLPFTGIPIFWVLLAGFAILAAGLALWRVAPRREA